MIEEKAGTLEYCKDWMLFDVINCIFFWSTFASFIAAIAVQEYLGAAATGILGGLLVVSFLLNLCSICKS